MPDGIRLAARVWMPVDAETVPVPAILECVPYRKRDGLRARDDAMHPYFAGHGYAVLRIDLRGSGESEGLPDDEYTPAEQQDLLAAVDWVSRQNWCSGRVGMMGISWGGFNSLQVAMHRPPALKAVIAVCASDDRYNDDVHYMQGCLLHDNFAWASAMYAFVSQPPDPALVGEAWRDMWLKRLQHYRFPLRTWLAHQRRDAYWRQASVCEDYDAIACPVFAVGGWEDGYSNAISRLVENLKAPCLGLIGPWGHAYPHQALPGPAIGFLQEALRWWDHWLKDRDTGIMAEPRLRVWMNDSYEPDPVAMTRPGRWIAQNSVTDNVAEQILHLAADGLHRLPGGTAQRQVRSPGYVGINMPEWCSNGHSDGDYAGDQRSDDGGSLCFDGDVLPERLEIYGTPTVDLAFSVDRPVAKIAVRLNDVAPDGASTRVTYTLYSLNHHLDQSEPIDLIPGQVYRARIALNEIAHAFLPGHRLRVAISTSYWPQLWPSPAPVTLTVDCGSSRLHLPVRNAGPDDVLLHTFEPPVAAPTSPGRETRPGSFRRCFNQEVESGKVAMVMDKDYGGFHFSEIDLTADVAAHETYRLDPADPLTATAEIRYHHELSRDGWQVRTETWSSLRCTRTHFHVTARLDAFENGQRVFSTEDAFEILRDRM